MDVIIDFDSDADFSTLMTFNSAISSGNFSSSSGFRDDRTTARQGPDNSDDDDVTRFSLPTGSGIDINADSALPVSSADDVTVDSRDAVS